MRRLLMIGFVVLAAGGCECGTPATNDAGTDAGPGLDAGTGMDAGTDADGGADAGTGPSLAIDDVTLAEGTGDGGTTFVFTVSLSAPPQPGADVTVDWTTADRTAAAPADFAQGQGTLTFTSGGALSQSVSVTVEGDADVEPDEAFAVTLGNASNATIADAEGLGTVQADDFPTAAIDDVAIQEGDTGTTTLSFTVTLTEAPPAGYPASLAWATADDTASAASDYAAGNGTLTFQPGGALTQTLDVTVNGDTAPEADETLRVLLSAPVNVALPDAEGTGTILNDEGTPISIDDVSVEEGNGPNVRRLVFTVTALTSPPPGLDAQVSWATAAGTAQANDFTAASGTLTFTNGGASTQVVTVQVTPDTDVEADETVEVRLSALSGAALVDGTGVGTIVADDFPTVAIADGRVIEGNAGTTLLTLAVTITPEPPAGLVSRVDWATQTDSAGTGDFTSASGTLTFSNGGGTTQSVTVPVSGDVTVEQDEWLFVELSNPARARLGRNVARATIENDDGAVLRVDPTAPGPATGLTWAAAFTTVQAAVDAAQAAGGGEVWVAAGSYGNGGGSGAVLTMRANVAVFGGFEGYAGGTGAQETARSARDPVAHVTTLDGANTALHVVLGADDARLDGFTIRGGNAAGANADGRGGGMYNLNASPVVERCLFTANAAALQGGGVYNAGTGSAHTRPVFLRTTIDANTSGDYAGGMHNQAADARLVESVVSNNVAANYAGGVHNSSSAAVFEDCLVDGNRADYGGGIDNNFLGVTVLRTTISNNVADNGASFGGGGGFYDSFASSRIYDSHIVGNRARSQAAGLFFRDSGAVMDNTVVERNVSSNLAGGLLVWNTLRPNERPVFTRLLFRNNRASEGGGAYNDNATATYVSCAFEGNVATTRAGGMYNHRAANTLVVNGTFSNDVAPNAAELYGNSFSSSGNTTVTVRNSIVWNDTAAATLIDVAPGLATITVATSDVKGGYGGTGNLNLNPLFVSAPAHVNRIGSGATTTSVAVTAAGTWFGVGDTIELDDDGVARTITAIAANTITFAPATAAALPFGTRIDRWPGGSSLDVDLRLDTGSPCIDAATNASVPADTLDVDDDGDTMEPVPLDVLGQPRFVDSAEADTGVGPAPLADLGAYERQ